MCDAFLSPSCIFIVFVCCCCCLLFFFFFFSRFPARVLGEFFNANKYNAVDLYSSYGNHGIVYNFVYCMQIHIHLKHFEMQSKLVDKSDKQKKNENKLVSKRKSTSWLARKLMFISVDGEDDVRCWCWLYTAQQLWVSGIWYVHRIEASHRLVCSNAEVTAEKWKKWRKTDTKLKRKSHCTRPCYLLFRPTHYYIFYLHYI